MTSKAQANSCDQGWVSDSEKQASCPSCNAGSLDEPELPKFPGWRFEGQGGSLCWNKFGVSKSLTCPKIAQHLRQVWT